MTGVVHRSKTEEQKHMLSALEELMKHHQKRNVAWYMPNDMNIIIPFEKFRSFDPAFWYLKGEYFVFKWDKNITGYVLQEKDRSTAIKGYEVLNEIAWYNMNEKETVTEFLDALYSFHYDKDNAWAEYLNGLE